MDIPVVLIHRSEQSYVSYALRAAKTHNKKVVIITDVVDGSYARHTEVADIHAYRSSHVEKFTAVYQHLSSNSYAFEYGCIERWFILLEFMKKHRLEKIIYVDSDVILYGNLSNVMNDYFPSYNLCLCIPHQQHEDFLWLASGHISLWTLDAVELFCTFILETYTNKIGQLKEKWEWHEKNNFPGGICDMTLLYLFQLRSNLKIGNFLSVTDDRFCFDTGMNTSRNEYPEEYQMTPSFLLGHDIKKIVFHNHLPSCKNLIRNSNIHFWCLHFQGDAKTIMPFYIRDNKNAAAYFSDLFARIKVWYWSVRRLISGKKS